MNKIFTKICYSLLLLSCSKDLSAQTANTIVTSVNSGFFNAPFTVNISSAQIGDSVLYTLHGTDPRISGAPNIQKTPFSIAINPASAIGRDQTPAVTLMLSIKKNGVFSLPTCKTYTFIANVKTQSYPNGNYFPAPSPINSQVIDYDMDTKVTNSTLYKDSIDDALLALPSLSIITKVANLFDATTGIYVNPNKDSKAWERQVSVELINPDNTPGFQVQAGMRIRGGYSRNKDNPKHAFRLFFRQEYGDAKLNFPLFGNEGVNEFDKIDIRTSQNYSWSMEGDNRGVMIRDIFSRDLQGAMGQPYTRGRFYHLYLDGMYWGIYQSDERTSASFGEAYLGGSKEDYDVVKVETTLGYTIEATDGNLLAWQEVWNLCQLGFASNDNFFKVQGLNNAGIRDTSLPVLVDLNNLIDYMLLIFYTGNVDAPVSEFLGNDNPNNFFAIYNRKKKNGFKFIAHDSEHTLLVDPGNAGSGISENRVNIGSNGEMVVTTFNKFQPQWLHYKLSENANYRSMFIDRVYKRFSNKGVMTESNLKKLFSFRAAQIQTAIIAESARWGDAQSSWYANTKENAWLPEISNIMNNFFPAREGILKTQLINENLYNTVEAPVFNNQSTDILTSVFKTISPTTIALINNNANGTIYYSLNGIDPRAIDGATSTSAVSVVNNGTVAINTSGKLLARIFSNGTWSPLHELMILIPSEYEKLKLTEIHYHPVAANTNTPSSKYEFIELKNTGATPLNLSGLAFTSGIRYTFEEGSTLAAGEYLVLSANDSVFTATYGFHSFDNYKGNLNDSADQILLNYANGDTLLYVAYLDTLPWPVTADGFGPSLVSTLANPIGDQNSYTKWKPSYNSNGSPKQDDPTSLGIDAEENIFTKIYPNPLRDIVFIEVATTNKSNYIIEVLDALGQLVYSSSGTGSKMLQVDFSSFSSAMYFLKVSSSTVNKTEKLLKID